MKKTPFIVLCTLFSSLSIASSPVSTVKVHDGTVALCRTKKDVSSFRNRLGAYQAKAIKAEVINNDTIQISVSLKFLQCENQRGVVGFRQKSPLSPIQFEQKVSSDRSNQVEVEIRKVVMKAYKDGVYKLLVNKELTDESSQIHLLEIALEDIVNDSDRSKASLDLFIQKHVTYKNLSSGDGNFDDARSFGNYRLHLSLKEDSNGRITAKVIK